MKLKFVKFCSQVLPFDSSRKCMSIVVRHPISGEIVLYSKGADSTVLPSLSSTDEDTSSMTKIRQQLNSYARQGLRTLVMARRTLGAQEFETWRQRHLEAEVSTENRDRRIRDSYSLLESHLTLLGVTGIEDKLQAGVPETMEALVSAGIVVWVLTGILFPIFIQLFILYQFMINSLYNFFKLFEIKFI